MIRALQPDILINDRLPGVGDYDTPEQFVPAEPPARALGDLPDDERELGLQPDRPRLQVGARARSTRSARSRGAAATCSLNVGPMGDGSLPPEQIERLDAIARLDGRRTARASSTRRPGLEPWQFYGPSTRQGDRIYLHCSRARTRRSPCAVSPSAA